MKIQVLGVLFLVTFTLFSLEILAAENPVFSGKENQIVFQVGNSLRQGKIEGFGSKDHNETFYKSNLDYLSVTYSVPKTLFGIHSRRNFEFGGMLGRKNAKVEENGAIRNENFSKYNQFVAGVSQDLIFGKEYLYLSVGLGAYFKSKSTDRINSKFTFDERLALGTNVKNINFEIFFRHFSNGGLTKKNSGQNFIGVAVGFDF